MSGDSLQRYPGARSNKSARVIWLLSSNSAARCSPWQAWRLGRFAPRGDVVVGEGVADAIAVLVPGDDVARCACARASKSGTERSPRPTLQASTYRRRFKRVNPCRAQRTETSPFHFIALKKGATTSVLWETMTTSPSHCFFCRDVSKDANMRGGSLRPSNQSRDLINHEI
jgi:hypothetical protein